MRLKIWWQKRQETLLKEEIDAFLGAYIKGYAQSPETQRKILAHQCFPRVGQDSLALKERFLREYSIHEHEFRKNYLRERQSGHFACRYSLSLEEKARLAGHKKWCEMMRRFRENQKNKTR